MVSIIRKILRGLKKVWVLIAISFLITFASVYALFHHYTASGSGEDFIYKLESKVLDLKFMIRGEMPASGKVGILAIDEKTLTDFGEYPFNRRYYKKAYENLKELGVKVIGFDVIFIEEQKARLIDAKEQLLSLENNPKDKTPMEDIRKMLEISPADSALASGIAYFENIVLGYFYFEFEGEAKLNLGDAPRFAGLEAMEDSAIPEDFMGLLEGKTLSDYPAVLQVAGIRTNNNIVSSAGENFAFFSNQADDDAINRWVTLVVNVDGRLMPSLALKAAAMGLDRVIVTIFGDSGIETIILADPEEELEPIEIPVDPLGRGRVLLNHRGEGRRAFHHYSLADAYENTFTEEEKKNLKGSILLLGATATGTNDLRPNPFDSAIDGVENHAAAIDNIIQGDLLRREEAIFQTEMLIVLISGLLFAPIMIWGSAIWSAVAVVLFLAGYYLVDYYLWWGKGLWTFMAVPFIEITFMFMVMTVYKYISEEKDKKFLKEAFGSYISPELIEEMAESGAPPQLGGDVGILTAFFTDIQGFSSFSEKLSAPKLVELLNEYLTVMTDILLEEKGTLDKYEGDAIIAFFGAPMTLEDHATRAVRVAVRMQLALLELRKKWVSEDDKWPEIVKQMKMRIGVNSGEIVTGNMGSRDRMNYTMMGDSVNLAARLEEAAKQYGIFTHISHFTKDLLEDDFELRELDTIRVVGKSEPVTTYDVLGIKGNTDELLLRLNESFSQGLVCYKNKEWDNAIEFMEKSLVLEHERFPEQKDVKPNPSNIYIERSLAFKKDPPPEDWDGVFTLTSK